MPFLTRNVRLRNGGVVLGYHEWDGRIVTLKTGDVFIIVKSWVDQAAQQSGDPPAQEKRIRLVKADIAAALAAFQSAITTEVAGDLANYLEQIK